MLFGCRSTGPRASRWVGRLLLTAALFAVPLLMALPAQAQQPRLAISEININSAATDAVITFLEIANLGDQPWAANDFWLMRADESSGPAFIRFQGLDPVPPNGVLFVAWGKPRDDGAVACTTKGNVFCISQADLPGGLGGSALAIFAPTTNNATPTLATGTMLAYFTTVSGGDAAALGLDKAVAAGLWKAGDFIARDGFDTWTHALRMGSLPYPPNHGRSSSDYYATLSNFDAITMESFGDRKPDDTNFDPEPNTGNRAGTPARVNYLHPGTPIPGQIAANVFAIGARAIAASTAAGAPAAMQVVTLGRDGSLATSLFANNAWSPIAAIAGTPAADGITMVNNPVKGTRTILVRAKADGALSALTSTGTAAAFATPLDLAMKAKFAPAAAVDATGNEHYVVVDSAGAIQHNVNESGKLRGWQAIAVATTDAPVAVAASADPAVVSVVAFVGNQLTLFRLGADGKFAPGVSVGSAVSARPAGIGPVAAWNTQAKRLEILAVVGALTEEPDGGKGAAVQHARAELSLTEAKVGALAPINGIETNTTPAIAINATNGQVRMVTRGGGREPGKFPRIDPPEGDPGDASGLVLATTFDGSVWGTPQRIGRGRLPGGPSDAGPQSFPGPVAPVSLFDANTGRIQDFLIGEDAQVYHNSIGP